jgi:magnesium chelatase family protein
MSLARGYAVSLLGLAGNIIEVEADISSNLPAFVLVGLPDTSLSEASSRVRAAVQNSGLRLPARRITINLSPASIPKFGSSFDLAIAITLLAADGSVSPQLAADWVHIGELGLDGSIRAVRGILPAVLACRNAGRNRVVVPLANLSEAKLVSGLEIVGASHLNQVAVLHGADVANLARVPVDEAVTSEEATPPYAALDIGDVLGQESAVQALTIAAAGGHHLSMIGPPGAGKTMLAERLPSLLPDLTLEQSLETTAIHSVAGRGNEVGVRGNLFVRPPFEAPHHSSSMVSLVGGGTGLPRPGAISLANHGVLFLDEAPEFQLPALEALRQPLESGEVLIHRSAGTARFPSHFQLVIAANPCPCGLSMSPKAQCLCSPHSKNRYAAKLSGPLLDRIDINLRIHAVTTIQKALFSASDPVAETSAQVRERVTQARMAAAERLAKTPWSLNAQVPGHYLRHRLKPTSSITRHLDAALDRGRISMRGYDRVLRLAWTKADIDGKSSISSEAISFAMFLRGSELGVADA